MSNARELAELGGSYGTGGSVGMKNRIINGAGLVAQRTTTTVTADNGGTAYPIDRFRCFGYGGGVFTGAQSATVPTGSGFVKSVYMTVTTPDSSIVSGDYYAYTQYMEGLNTADLEWGTANAKPITVSFWCRSSVTGTYASAILNAAGTRGYPATFTISAADTWQYVSLTIPGCTDGSWPTDNTASFAWRLDLGSGPSNYGTANTWNSSAGTFTGLRTSTSTNWIATSGATFYITGVQLEKGSTATSFDYRPYGTELALCQRYYQRSTSGGSNYCHLSNWGSNASTTTLRCTYPLKTSLRAAPSSVDFSNLCVDDNATAPAVTGLAIYNTAAENAVALQATVASGLTTFRPAIIANVSGVGYIGISAEL